jgi:hypothetical protein
MMQPAEPRSNPSSNALGFNVSGVGNTAVNAGSVGRDINIGHHFHQKPHAPAVAQGQFFAVALEDFGKGLWVEPPQASEFVRLLEEHHLLILAGDLDEKKDCAHHIVYCLRERLRQKGREEVQVLEKCSGRDPQRIETALDGDEPKILILPDVSPRQIVSQTPATLRSLLRDHQSYAVITTDHGPGDWDIVPGSPEAQLWRKLSWESYYGAGLLSEFIRSYLRNSDKGIREPLLPEPDGPMLMDGLELKTVAEKLRTPGKVRYFCDWLLQSEESLSREMVLEQLARSGHDDKSVGIWYRQFDARQQLLILGLTLFDGLPDHVIFTGLELLVENIWRTSDPAIPQFDYGDLVHCGASFRKVKSRDNATRIISASQDRRQQLLQLAWDQQRRRLLAALPVLREMIRISAVSEEKSVSPSGEKATEQVRQQEVLVFKRGTAGRALNRSEEDTLQLHQALVDSLSLISRLSQEVVKDHFLELAADDSTSVQELVARALSTWRDEGRAQEQQLFALLHEWWTDACEPWNTNSRLARLGQSEDPFAAVRAAVALIVGYSARFDHENQMNPRLYELLVSMLEDRHPRVREAVKQALQLAVAWHLRQLEPLLRMRVLQSDDFLGAISRGGAEACSLRTDETVAILDNWRAVARAEKRRSSPDRISPRERILATVALTYGEIRAVGGEWPLRPEILCANLRSILMEESHPFVRRKAFEAIEKQALQNFELVVQLLQDLLSQIQLPDRPAVVKIFVKTYLHQRNRMTGGEKKIDVEGRKYDIWIETPRPLTEIEATLYGWLLDNSHPIVQQLAVDVFDELGRTLLEKEERRVKDLGPLMPRNELIGMSFNSRPQPQVHNLPILGHAAVYCVAPQKEAVRATIQPLLAEVIVLHRQRAAIEPTNTAAHGTAASAFVTTRSPAEVLFERWGAISNDATKAIARLVRRAFFLYRWRWLFVTLMVVTATGIYKGAPILVEKVRESVAARANSSPSPDVSPRGQGREVPR